MRCSRTLVVLGGLTSNTFDLKNPYEKKKTKKSQAVVESEERRGHGISTSSKTTKPENKAIEIESSKFSRCGSSLRVAGKSCVQSPEKKASCGVKMLMCNVSFGIIRFLYFQFFFFFLVGSLNQKFGVRFETIPVNSLARCRAILPVFTTRMRTLRW